MGALQGNDLSKPQVLKMEKEGDTKCLVLKQEEQDDTNKPADQKKTAPCSEGEANQK